MRSRWTEVQSAFVDDPRDCVQKADGLVADVVDKLTTGFSGASAHLEEQWSRGEEVSTEDLRIALNGTGNSSNACSRSSAGPMGHVRPR